MYDVLVNFKVINIFMKNKINELTSDNFFLTTKTMAIIIIIIIMAAMMLTIMWAISTPVWRVIRIIFLLIMLFNTFLSALYLCR